MDSNARDEKKSKVSSAFALVITSHVLNHTYDSLLPILYPSMISEFNLSYSLVGMLAMGYRLSSGALQILMGFLGRYVRRKILLGLGMIWQCIANFFTVISQGFEGVLIGRTLAGIGSSPQHPTGAAYIAENFSEKQLGRALGVNITAAQIGSFITPLIGSLLLSRFGWRTTLLAFSVPGILIGVMFLFITESKRSGSWDGLSSLTVLFNGVREVLRNRTVLAVMIVETVMAFRIAARDFIPSYLQHDLVMTPLEAGILFTIFMGSGIPAPYFLGYLSDKFGRRKVVMTTLGMTCVLWYLLPYGRNSFQLLLILIPLGFVCQSIGGVIQAFIAEATTKENHDLIYGIYFTLAFTIGSLSPVILGYLADSFGFQASFSYVALISLFATITSYLLK